MPPEHSPSHPAQRRLSQCQRKCLQSTRHVLVRIPAVLGCWSFWDQGPGTLAMDLMEITVLNSNHKVWLISSFISDCQRPSRKSFAFAKRRKPSSVSRMQLQVLCSQAKCMTVICTFAVTTFYRRLLSLETSELTVDGRLSESATLEPGDRCWGAACCTDGSTFFWLASYIQLAWSTNQKGYIQTEFGQSNTGIVARSLESSHLAWAENKNIGTECIYSLAQNFLRRQRQFERIAIECTCLSAKKFL